jgi:hypothetical protein
MTGENYYITTALPILGDLGSEPPLNPSQMMELAAHSEALKTLLEAVFLSDDLLQRQGYLLGEISELNLCVLTKAQGQDKEPLPSYLVTEAGGEESSKPAPEDELWAWYFRHMAQISRSRSSTFLSNWVIYEVSMRNALAEARAKALNLDANDYLVATELTDEQEDFSIIINEWSGAANPLAGQRVLDQARWEWLGRNESWFSFGDDELAAYAVKLMLLCRWSRLIHAEHNASAEQNQNQT